MYRNALNYLILSLLTDYLFEDFQPVDLNDLHSFVFTEKNVKVKAINK